MALAHAHTARRLQFSSSSDGLLLFLSEECWGRGLIRLAELLDDLLTERQAEQAKPLLGIPSWRCCSARRDQGVERCRQSLGSRPQWSTASTTMQSC
jgi:hypothetical protein